MNVDEHLPAAGAASDEETEKLENMKFKYESYKYILHLQTYVTLRCIN